MKWSALLENSLLFGFNESQVLGTIELYFLVQLKFFYI